MPPPDSTAPNHRVYHKPAPNEAETQREYLAPRECESDSPEPQGIDGRPHIRISHSHGFDARPAGSSHGQAPAYQIRLALFFCDTVRT